MNVTCPDCRSVFRVDPAKVPLGGVRARCSVCGGVISVTAPDFVESLGRASVAATAVAAEATTMVISAVTPPADEPPTYESEAATAFESDAEAAPEPAFDEPVAESALAAPPAVPTPPVTPVTPVTPVSRPTIPTMSPPMPGQDPGSTPRPFAAIGGATPARPTTGPSITPPRAPFSPPIRPTFAPPSTPALSSTPVPPAAATPTPPPFAPSVVPAPRMTQPRTMLPFQAPVVPGFRSPSTPPAAPPAVVVVPSRPSGSVPAVPADGTPRRVINPFLNNDPNQKGKRLARALVSDMVAYLPQKREEGLKNGTLKTLFREEIKKSYEEYVDQIGKEFADSTTHFQDALNEILAGGKKMF